MKITERDVYVYREMYYEYVKPMIRANKSDIEIDKCLDYWVVEFNITKEHYHALAQIDLLQRFANIKDDRAMIAIFGFSKEDLKNVLNLPELRCPVRSEQKTSAFTRK